MLTYEFHYYYIKNKYDNKSRLLFTETDTLMHQIKAEDVYDYEDFSNDKIFLILVFVLLNQNMKI